MIRVSRLSGESATLVDAVISRHSIGIAVTQICRAATLPRDTAAHVLNIER